MSADSLASRPAALIALLSVWGFAGYSLAADGANAGRSGSGSGAELVRQVKHAPELRANLSNFERYVVDGVCEIDGVRQISQILRRADFEEMWAFLPRAHGTNRCQWHEIGREEKAGSESAHVRVDMAYLEDLIAANTEIHLVHYHPLRYFECAAHPRCPREAPARRPRSVDQRWISDVVFSMPSASDVHFMMDVTSRFHRRHHGRGTIRHTVVTPYGVVDYGLTDAGLAKFDSERHSRSEGLYITWVAANALADDHVERVVKDHPGSIMAGVRRLAQALNTEFLWIAYSTFAWDVEHTAPRPKNRGAPRPNPVDGDRPR